MAGDILPSMRRYDTGIADPEKIGTQRGDWHG
jgi:hypothetical protein